MTIFNFIDEIDALQQRIASVSIDTSEPEFTPLLSGVLHCESLDAFKDLEERIQLFNEINITHPEQQYAFLLAALLCKSEYLTSDFRKSLSLDENPSPSGVFDLLFPVLFPEDSENHSELRVLLTDIMDCSDYSQGTDLAARVPRPVHKQSLFIACVLHVMIREDVAFIVPILPLLTTFPDPKHPIWKVVGRTSFDIALCLLTPCRFAITQSSSNYPQVLTMGMMARPSNETVFDIKLDSSTQLVHSTHTEPGLNIRKTNYMNGRINQDFAVSLLWFGLYVTHPPPDGFNFFQEMNDSSRYGPVTFRFSLESILAAYANLRHTTVEELKWFELGSRTYLTTKKSTSECSQTYLITSRAEVVFNGVEHTPIERPTSFQLHADFRTRDFRDSLPDDFKEQNFKFWEHPEIALDLYPQEQLQLPDYTLSFTRHGFCVPKKSPECSDNNPEETRRKFEELDATVRNTTTDAQP
eukprot:TRINITY_DN19034_c0_g1::TRINITY_DN19034_c0_g1_i1::g.13866::m.13866 TRINITY_DN19034_c0_g1::TRINITY_DN19034_c0_g1_i1::g.13866  ORF type:complete len:469 (-),score=17.20 TRINITY_DN19034_c0_g1_i1:18-1424(-)